MSLNQPDLKSRLKSELHGVFTIIDEPTLDKACGAIAKAIVDHILANSNVVSTAADPQGGTVNSTGAEV